MPHITFGRFFTVVGTIVSPAYGAVATLDAGLHGHALAAAVTAAIFSRTKIARFDMSRFTPRTYDYHTHTQTEQESVLHCVR